MKNITELKTLINKHRTLINFLITGGILFVIDFGVSLFMYYLVGLGPGISSGIGFTAGFIVGFTLNKKWVFKHDSKSRFNVSAQLILYLLLAVFNLIISSVAVEVIVGKGIMIEIVKPITVIVIAFWNFLIFKFFIFSKKTN